MGDTSSHMLGRLDVNVSGKNPTPMRVPGLIGKRVLDVAIGSGQHIAVIVEEDS